MRAATGRDAIWGIGADMSPAAADGTFLFLQFLAAYEADYVAPDALLLDDAKIRDRLIRAVEDYASICRNGCAPPDSLPWSSGADNNRAFLDQTVVMTPNPTLSIPNALKATRPEDYDENAATIDWPGGAHGQPLAIYTAVERAFVFKDGGHVATAKEFVSFLVGEGWLAHYLHFSGERMIPAMPKLLEAPLWLDPSDPHRMRSATQLLTRPQTRNYVPLTGGTVRSIRRMSGRRLFIASPPESSPPSRRSTRRSPGSSSSWRSDASRGAETAKPAH